MFLRSRNKEQGSILLEALLSTVILSVSITIIIHSMIASLRATKYTADYSVALILADNKINNLRVKGNIESGKREEKSFSDYDKKFRYLMQTSQFSDENAKGINKVDMDVLWANGAKRNKILFSTYLLDAGDLIEVD